ncbi:MAG: YggS family pyridoxal phosphate-dependent enzyme [Clostridiales bacterium]|nr:YggS family pyridoxal phosphate-dependent enzyme [Clostridiales bacterium]
MENIKGRLDDIKDRVARAAQRSGRSPEDITIVAVSKLREPEEIEEAIAAGISDFGENKVQELELKYDKVISPLRWHLIGHLQRNKVKYIIDKVALIHSLDSLRLAKEIDKRAEQAGVVAEVLVQVNAAGEESKFGVSSEDAAPLIDKVLAGCSNVRIRGLMQIAPYSEEPEDVRPYFKELKQLYDELSRISHPNLSFDYLSMGMSGDFELAIEEGANMVRIGSAIFGDRDYSKRMGGL